MKRGDISLSFGMIFSIILIIAIIGVSFYVISNFLGLKKCSEVGLFFNDFEGKVDKAWSSEITRDTYSGIVASGIKSVCIGNLTLGGSGTEYDAVKKYSRAGANVFLYPPEKACDVKYMEFEHLDVKNMRLKCFPVINGKVEIGIEKGASDALVQIR